MRLREIHSTHLLDQKDHSHSAFWWATLMVNITCLWKRKLHRPLSNQPYQKQIHFIYIAQNRNRIASMGFTVCTVNNILCPSLLWPSVRVRKNFTCWWKKNPFNRVKKKTMEETSGRATEEGSLFHDGQTCNRCCMYRKVQPLTVYKLH